MPSNPSDEELVQWGMQAFREVQARMDLRLAPGETMQVRLPGGAFLTIYAAPSGHRPLVQVTLPISEPYKLLVEHREPAPGQQECGFIRMFER